MSIKSNIEWTDSTWNVARGCTKVDEECKFCYMYRDSMNGTRYNPKAVVKTKTVFNLPLKLKTPSKIFTSSLTDFFHEEIDSYRNEAWDIIRRSPQHTFQILTKRPERIKDHLPEDWGNGWDNVWLGTSVGTNGSFQRAIELKLVPAKVRFLSVEPLLEEVVLGKALLNYYTEDKSGITYLKHPVSNAYALGEIHWVIVGGESGNENGKYRYRPCELAWIEQIVNECKANNVPVFVKQLGTYLSKQLKLKDRHGKNINEWPEHLQIRQFPL